MVCVTMKLGLGSLSYHVAFDRQFMDAFRFIERCVQLGLAGAAFHADGPRLGHLGNDDAGYLREVGEHAVSCGLFVEVSVSGTDPLHLRAMLEVCRLLRADVLRTSLSSDDGAVEDLDGVLENLRQTASVARDVGVRIGVGAGEHETTDNLIGIIEGVASEWVGAHVDTGSPMMVWEDPIQAARKLSRLALSGSLSDRLVVMEGNGPLVAGVAVGEGSVNCAQCCRFLKMESKLRRLAIEVGYGRSGPFHRPQEEGAGGRLGEGAFVVRDGGRELSRVLLRPEEVPSEAIEQLVQWQDSAVRASVAYVRGLRDAFAATSSPFSVV